jgi:uncharacterized protein (TIGR00255 family)
MSAPAKSNRIASMTGFARADGGVGPLTWTVEIKSVNGRALDLRCRAPSGYDAVEAAARSKMQGRLARGSVNLALSVNRAAAQSQVRINRPLLEELRALLTEISGINSAPPQMETLLTVRGVVEPADDGDAAPDRPAVEKAMIADVEKALDGLVAARLAEGERLEALLRGHLTEIARLVEDAAQLDCLKPEAVKERLRAAVQALVDGVPALSEERLAQEAALLMVKADVREEIDRLRSHIQAALDLLNEGGAVGRKFDFLCQEFNREANTLCSKSVDGGLTRIGLALKAAIDQLREQVQNVE